MDKCQDFVKQSFEALDLDGTVSNTAPRIPQPVAKEMLSKFGVLQHPWSPWAPVGYWTYSAASFCSLKILFKVKLQLLDSLVLSIHPFLCIFTSTYIHWHSLNTMGAMVCSTSTRIVVPCFPKGWRMGVAKRILAAFLVEVGRQTATLSMLGDIHMGVNPKIRGKLPKWMVYFNKGKPY